jgi:hypothetical protein
VITESIEVVGDAFGLGVEGFRKTTGGPVTYTINDDGAAAPFTPESVLARAPCF